MSGIKAKEMVITVVSFVITFIALSYMALLYEGRTAGYIKTRVISSYTGNETLKPYGVAVSPDGLNVYVSSIKNSSISVLVPPQKAGEEWAIKNTFGVKGDKPGRFNEPSGICVDSAGNIYAADTVNGRIQKFSPDGKFITAIDYSKSIFYMPRNAVIAPDGDIYVANTGKWNIYRFSGAGEKRGTFAAMSGEVFGLAVDNKGRVLAANAKTGMIEIFTPNLEQLSTVSVKEWKSVENNTPMIALDSKGNLYAVARAAKAIAVFKPAGEGYKRAGVIANDENGRKIFTDPLSIAIDINGNIYVTESAADKVLKIKPEL